MKINIQNKLIHSVMLRYIITLLAFMPIMQAGVLYAQQKPLKTAADDATALYIKPNGDVGIGTTDPSTKLEVRGDALVTGSLRVNTLLNIRGIVDIMGSQRTGNHPSGLLMYATGMGERGQGVEFRTSDGTEGIGFSKNNIYQTGADKNLSFETFGRGFIIMHTGGQQRVYITSEGAVGINGPTAIHNKLHMDGNAVFFRAGTDSADYVRWNPDGSDKLTLAGWNGVQIGASWHSPFGKPIVALSTDERGFVGIGIANPDVPLFINRTRGSDTKRYDKDNSRAFDMILYNQGNVYHTTRTWGDCSVYSIGDIVTKAGFVGAESTTFSDIRLKKDIKPTSSKDDLDRLNAIQVVNYKMIDTIANNRAYKKVIAQQVQQVYPIAVGNSFHTLPDVFEHAVSVSKQADSLYLISVAKPAKLKTGDQLELKCSGAGDAVVTVTGISDETHFVVSSKLELSKQRDIFVYGHPAVDVLTVDYEAIGMLNVSATQQLSKTIDAQQQQLLELKAANQKLAEENEELHKEQAATKLTINNILIRLAQMNSPKDKLSASTVVASVTREQ